MKKQPMKMPPNRAAKKAMPMKSMPLNPPAHLATDKHTSCDHCTPKNM